MTTLHTTTEEVEMLLIEARLDEVNRRLDSGHYDSSDMTRADDLNDELEALRAKTIQKGIA